MNKKTSAVLSALCAVAVLATTAGCGNSKPVHTHTFFDIDPVASTCVTEGTKAYKECLYCKEKQIDGKKVSDEDIVVPVNANNHEHIIEVEAKDKKCVADGCIEHEECTECGAYVLNGENVEESAILIKAKGSHSWTQNNGLECGECEATRHFANGNEYAVGEENYHAIEAVKGAGMSAGYSATGKTPYLSYYPEHRMEFAAQYSNADQQYKSENGNWVVTNTSGSSGHVNSFTRFAYGKGSEAYVGRFVMTYDFTSSVTTTGTQLQRIGVQVTDSTATAVDTTKQSKLIGNHADAQKLATALTKDVVYSFAYLIEFTEESQLVQIFNCINAAVTTTVSNLHFINLDEEPTGTAGARLLYFGEKSNSLMQLESCDHSYAYAVEEREATCTSLGAKAHEHCPVCGKNKIDGGFEADLDLSLPMLEHTPEGNWQADAEGHWKVCSVCLGEVGKTAHTAGAAPTQTTPQTCTVCGYVLADALCEHEIAPVEAKPATCTQDGNSAYYKCGKCEGFFSDAQGKEYIIDKSSVVIPADKNAHNFGGGTSCQNGCGATKEILTIAAAGANALGSDGNSCKADLIANPGKWASQYGGTVTQNITDGVLKAVIKEGASDNANKIFVRYIPVQDGAAFVGSYELSFDFKVTEKTGSATALKLLIGFDIQSTASPTDVTGTVAIADEAKTLTVGKTYRITLRVETVTAMQFVQMNVRNTANCGATVEISNASVIYNPASYKTGANTLAYFGEI